MDKFLLVKILYSAASIQGLFLGILLFRTNVNQPANRILSVLIFILSFHLVLVGFDNREFFMTFPHLSRVSWIIGSLYWPLLFLFVQHITRTQPAVRWKNFWLFIPFMVLLIIMMPFYVLSADEKRAIITDFEKSSEEDFGPLNQAVSLLHIFFQSFCLIYYLRLEKKLYEEYAEIESIRIKWLKQFLLFILAATVLAVFSFFSRTWNVPVFSEFYRFHFIGIVFLFYWVSYNALTHPVIFGLHPSPLPDLPSSTPESSEKYVKSAIESDKSLSIFQTVREAVEGKRLYLKKDLTLTELSTHINIPRHQVSQAINAQYRGNFFDLINDYRVAVFKRLVVDPSKKHMNLLGIAQESGFNSKASFYAIFKKKTGMTPSEYLESQSHGLN